jgi:transposase
MARKQKVLPEMEEDSSDGIPLRARGKQRERVLSEVPKPEEPEKHWRSMSPEPRHLPASSVNDESAQSPSQVSRTNRYARYEGVRALHQQAISQREIARRLHLSRQTVRKFLVAESFPERSRSAHQGSILDPYKPYILERWKAGCWNGSQLYAEVKARGYTGSVALFRLFMSSVRKQHRAAGTSAALELSADGAKICGPTDPLPNPGIKRRLSPARAAFLYVSQAVKLDEKQREQIAQIRVAHADLDTAYELTQAFVSMLADHRDTDLESWLAQAELSGIRSPQELCSRYSA